MDAIESETVHVRRERNRCHTATGLLLRGNVNWRLATPLNLKLAFFFYIKLEEDREKKTAAVVYLLASRITIIYQIQRRIKNESHEIFYVGSSLLLLAMLEAYKCIFATRAQFLDLPSLFQIQNRLVAVRSVRAIGRLEYECEQSKPATGPSHTATSTEIGSLDGQCHTQQ